MKIKLFAVKKPATTFTLRRHLLLLALKLKSDE
jgi:hypothetical protein